MSYEICIQRRANSRTPLLRSPPSRSSTLLPLPLPYIGRTGCRFSRCSYIDFKETFLLRPSRIDCAFALLFYRRHFCREGEFIRSDRGRSVYRLERFSCDIERTSTRRLTLYSTFYELEHVSRHNCNLYGRGNLL